VEGAKPRTSPSLGEDLENVRTYDRRCGIARVLEEVSSEDGEKLISAIDNPMASTASIAAILRDHGFEASEKMVYRHRNRGRGGCGCPR
jgi:hypothetical protein